MAFPFCEDTRYVKLYLLLVKGGTFASKKHILKISNSDNTRIDDCLLNSKDIIYGALKKKHISTKQWDILFPQASTPTELECWDVSLHTYILLNIFNDKMDQFEVIAFRALRDKRNELAHIPSTIMSEEIFLAEWSQVTMVLFQLTRGLTSDEQKDSNDIVNRIARIAYYDNAASELKSFEGSDEFLNDLFSEKLKSHERQMNDVLQRLKDVEDFKRDIENGQLNITARMTVSASTQTARDTAQQVLLNATSASLGQVQTDDDDVLTAINNLFSEIRDEGVDIGTVEEGSVLVTLCCPTIQALKKISQYLANKMYNERLMELQSALSDCIKWPVKLNINIVLETLCLALSQIENNKSVVLSLKCKGSEGVRTAVGLLLNRTSTNPVNRISEALSRAVGQRIEVHTTIEPHKLESDIAEQINKPTINDQNTEKQLTTYNTTISHYTDDSDSDGKTSGYNSAESDADDIDMDQLDLAYFRNCEYIPKEEKYKLRKYQIELAQDAINGRNTIICSETGTGKIWVACEIIKRHLEAATDERRKVAYMGRTSILVRQIAYRLKQHLPMHKTKLITGEKEDSKQLSMYLVMNDIICLNPQILVNNLDIKTVRSLSEFSLLILDECHHTRGNEPYNRLMRKYLVEKSENVHGLPQIIGLTASIGVGKSRTEDEAVDYILRVMACLDVRILSTVEKNIAALRQHTNMPVEETIPLEKPDFDPCKDILLVAIEETEDLLVDHALMQPDIIDLIPESQPREKESQAYNKWTVDLLKSAQLKVDDHGISRDICACARYLNTYNSALEINKLLRAKDVIKYLAGKHQPDGMHKDKHTEMEKTLYQKLLDVQKKLRTKGRDTENPNVRTLSDTLKNMLDGKGEDSRALVFVKARATCRSLAEFLAQDLHRSGYKTCPLYGKENRGGDDGMTESVQTDILEKFREGFFKVLVCTSVGNEGIDVPQCNIVLSYEYSGDEITKIQMKGRARRKDATITLMADEKMLGQDRINVYKAAMMYRALKRIKSLEPKYLETKVRQFQMEELSKHLFKVETEFYKKGRKSDEDHDILCGRCNVFACYVSYVRQMGSNHVVIDKAFADKVERKEHRRQTLYNGLHKKFKMFCKICGLDWGVICICKGLYCYVLKIENMKFRNHLTKLISVYKYWLGVPYSVPEMTPEDVPRLLGDQ